MFLVQYITQPFFPNKQQFGQSLSQNARKIADGRMLVQWLYHAIKFTTAKLPDCADIFHTKNKWTKS